MRKIAVTVLVCGLACQTTFAQNIFPADGNAGINTTSPRSRVEVVGTGMFSSSANGSYILLDATGLPTDNTYSNVRLTAGGSGGSAYLKTGLGNNAGYFTWTRNSETGTIEIMRIDATSRNVGIGTTSPQARLDVAGQVSSWNTGFGSADVNTSSKNLANFGSNNTGSVIMSSNVYMNSNKQMFTAKAHSSMAGAAIVIPGSQELYQNSILFYTKPVGAVSQDALYTGDIAMMINSTNSNVGIGTTTPTDKLSVNGSSSFSGTVRFQGLASNNTYNKALVADDNGNLFYRDISTLQGGSGWGINGNLGSDPATNFIGTTDNQPVAFRTNNAEQMRIAGNGNVGIGTASPSEKLAVNGNVRAKKVIVTQSNWPDYVFAPSYKLPSLDSISVFIKTNRHLPEMPSAATVEKDGQDVGEIQKQLLKKMEEMTLYIIEQNKQIQQLQKEVLELRQTKQ